MSHQHRIDPLGFKSGSQGLGIPPLDKFRSGHLPRGAIPVSQSKHTNDVDSRSVSDADEYSDTEAVGCRYAAAVPRQHYYSSDTYSDISSSRDTDRRQQRQKQSNLVQRSAYTEKEVDEEDQEEEEEESYSSGSSEFDSQAGRSNSEVVMASRKGYNAEVYSCNVPIQENTKAGQDHQSDVPSTPSFHGCDQETSQAPDQISALRSCGTQYALSSGGSTVKKEADTHAESDMIKQYSREISIGVEIAASSGSMALRYPNFHASGQGLWHSVIAYDACVRLCLHSWARGCMEAPIFLENECALLRDSFGLQHILLQSEEELLANRSSEFISGGATQKPKKILGKMKVQVCKVRMSVDMPSRCIFSSLKLPMIKTESLRRHFSNLQTNLSSRWESVRKVRVLPRLPADSSFSRHRLAYMHASAQYIKQVSTLLKIGVTTLHNSSSYEIVHETYSCHLRLKSSTEEDGVRMQPGSGETHILFPDSLGDDLIVDVDDSKGKFCGRVVAQLASIAEDPSNRLRWWSMYHEPEHELVGRVQLYVNYTTSTDENSSLKSGSVSETLAYDLVLEVAMKVQHFQQRNLLLHGSWKWLLTEFASYYGVSDAYTKLRYLSYVMDVATPSADCLMLVHDMLLPVILKSRSKNPLSHQENRILGELEEQIEQILALVFENYKSLDESSPSGIVEVYRLPNGSPAPALLPAVKLYTLLHDILSPEAQLKLCSYFQVAVKKRSRRHLLETDMLVTNNTEGTLMDVVTLCAAYQKMKTLCFNIRNEIYTDIEIHSQHVLPSFIDLPNISASIYSVDLTSRLRAFLVACPPAGPSPPVADLVIATADLQKDLANWNICPVKGGFDAKELFHLYIVLWIQEKRLALLEACKSDKVKWSGFPTQQLASPFVDYMYDRLKGTLNEFEFIVCRWPEYTFVLENAIADIEKGVVDVLEKQYADVLTPLKDNMMPKKFGLKYVQLLAKRHSICSYTVPDELGVLMNTMKRLIDTMQPNIEFQLKSWNPCIPNGENTVAGERLSEVTVLLRAKFRNYLQAVVEKLSENTRSQSATKLKKIIQDSKADVMESDIRNRMQPLKDQLIQTINHLHSVFECHVFVLVCRGYWDRMGQGVLSFLEDQKENKSCYRGARVAVSILDDTFASQMQQLLGNTLQKKDLEPPKSIIEVRSLLCKDAPILEDSNFYY